jgi:hypothetical protein
MFFKSILTSKSIKCHFIKLTDISNQLESTHINEKLKFKQVSKPNYSKLMKTHGVLLTQPAQNGLSRRSHQHRPDQQAL